MWNGNNNIEKRALLAVVLCLGILFFWQSLFFKNKPQPSSQPTAQKKMEPAEKAENTAPLLKYAATHSSSLQEKEMVVDTNLYQAIFSNYGAAIKSWKLKKYKDKIGTEGKMVEMVTQKDPNFYPLALHMVVPGYKETLGLEYEVRSQSSTDLLFVYEGKNIKVERSYQFKPDSYDFSHQTRIWIPVSHRKGDVFMGVSEGFPADEKKNILLAPYSDVRNFVYRLQDKTKREKLSALKNDIEIKQVVHWAGIENRYFVSALVNESKIKPYLLMSNPVPGTGAITLQFPLYREIGKEYLELSVRGYIGPKIVSLLNTVDQSFKEAVDFGMFSVICIPLLVTMNFFYKYCRNYGIAILLLTFLIRVLFHPLTKKSLKSMREMQRIQPQIAKIKEKFKDDRQQMNKEVMELMRANKVNPLGGCLPMLFQLPIFFALYRVLYNAIELYQAPFFGWIQDLSAKDPWYVLPVLMGIAMFIQQKMTPTATVDPAQKMMMNIMPIMFSFFMIALPSGLVLYILMSTLLQVLSQYLVNRDFSKKEI